LPHLKNRVYAKPICDKYLHRRIDEWRDTLSDQQGHVIFYITFLRVIPFLPDWFINITSPHVGVTYKTAFWSTFVGTIPTNFVAVEIGKLLREMETNIYTP